MLRVRVRWSGPVIVGGGLSTHYFTAGTYDQTAANNAASAIAAFWGAVDNQIGNSTLWSLDPVVAVMDPNGEQTGAFTVSAANGAGSLSAVYAPPTTQALVRWHTGTFVNGREVRGRTFIPGMVVANVAGGGGPVGTLTSAVNTAAAALIADANTTLAIWTKRNDSAYSVASGDMWTQFAVLRSRRD